MTLAYAVIGTGAIGGYFGGRLAKAGCDVHFLLRSDYAHVRESGIVVDSVEGDFALQTLNAYRDPADMPPVDVALVCLKTTHNSLLPNLLPALKPNGAILLLQNGLGVEATVEQILKENWETVPTLLGGLCFICASKVGPGHIRHIDYGWLLLGEHAEATIETISEQVEEAVEQGVEKRERESLLKEIATDFKHSKVRVDLTYDLPMARWRKLVWNVPYNGLSVVLDATTEEMMSDEGGVRALILELMREVVAVANAWGRQNSSGEVRSLAGDIVEQMFDHTETMLPYLTSMKLDFDRKRPMEVESILGNLLRCADDLEISTPAIKMLYQQLVFLDKRNSES